MAWHGFAWLTRLLVLPASHVLDRMISRKAPAFSLPAVEPNHLSDTVVNLDDYRGGWLVLTFYPSDFTFVCPTELTALSRQLPEFESRNAKIVAISVDSLDDHRRWMRTPTDQGGVEGLHFPLASDVGGVMSRAYGVYLEESGVAGRAMFLIDPDGVVQYLVFHTMSVGRRVTEILRVLDAVQTGGLCAEGWMSQDQNLDAADLLGPGRVVSHYAIDRLIGEGSAGRVFLAEDRVLRRPVALKVLHTDNADQLEKMMAEARLAASLTHPNICTIYAVEQDGPVPLIVMEYLDGMTLADVIGLEPIGVDDVMAILEQIADALALAHRLGIAHGDLKPANVIQTADRKCKILDFGLARVARKSGASSHPRTPDRRVAHERRGQPSTAQNVTVPSEAPKPMTVAVDAVRSLDATILIKAHDAARSKSSLSGTPLYMAPERWQGHGPSPASDVYALGLMACQLTTGRLPVEGDTIAEVARSIDVLDPEAAAAELPETMREWVAAALRYDATTRPEIGWILDRMRI